MLKFQDNNTTVIATFEDFIFLTLLLTNCIISLHLQKLPDDGISECKIIWLSLCGELAGVDSENAWFSFVKRNYRHLIKKSFNRTRRALMQTTELLRQK